MSNDDSNEPRWGERITPSPSSAPEAHDAAQHQYGQPNQPPQYGQAPQQQYGQPNQPPQWGQPQYGGAPGYGQQTPWDTQRGGKPAKGPRTLGAIALAAAVVALVLAVIGGILFGNAIAQLPGLADAAQNGGAVDQSQLQRALEDDSDLLGTLGVAGLLALIGTGFGIWAIVQGIIAAVRNRGRALGIVAIVLAVVAPIVFGVIYGAFVASAVGGN